MKQWKAKAVAMGMAAVVMTPGMVYGSSADAACNVNKVYQQIQNIKVCYETFQRENGTYCKDWSWILDQCGQNNQKPEGDIPEADAPETDIPETEQKPENGNPPVEETTPEEGDDDQDQDQAASAVAKEMLEQVNQERRAAGLSELTLSAKLSEVAQVKAEDMRDQGYFSHTSPTYGSPFDMMKQFGISYRSAGENIAKGYRSVSAVMDGWMNSSGHRANILSSDFTQLGVGYCTDSSGNGYWVQMFIRQ